MWWNTAQVNMGDGWETARRMDRPPVLECDETGNLTQKGNEWAVMQLGMPGEVSSVVIDTAHFKGNFPESVKVPIHLHLHLHHP